MIFIIICYVGITVPVLRKGNREGREDKLKYLTRDSWHIDSNPVFTDSKY
jgi:hypothetical protein